MQNRAVNSLIDPASERRLKKEMRQLRMGQSVNVALWWGDAGSALVLKTVTNALVVLYGYTNHRTDDKV